MQFIPMLGAHQRNGNTTMPASCMLFLLGSYLIVNRSDKDIYTSYFLGFSLIILAVLLAFVFLVHTFKPKMGLSFDNKTLVLNHTVLAGITVEWKYVTAIEVAQHRGSTYLLIGVKDPAQLIRQQRGWLTRIVMKHNHATLGTPLIINCKLFSTSPQELRNCLNSCLVQ